MFNNIPKGFKIAAGVAAPIIGGAVLNGALHNKLSRDPNINMYFDPEKADDSVHRNRMLAGAANGALIGSMMVLPSVGAVGGLRAASAMIGGRTPPNWVNNAAVTAGAVAGIAAPMAGSFYLNKKANEQIVNPEREKQGLRPYKFDYMGLPVPFSNKQEYRKTR